MEIRLLTSGTLTFGDLNKAFDGINVFLVGGGGGDYYGNCGTSSGSGIVIIHNKR